MEIVFLFEVRFNFILSGRGPKLIVLNAFIDILLRLGNVF